MSSISECVLEEEGERKMSEALCTFVSSLPSNQNTSHARRLSDGLARAISLLCRAFFHEPGHVDGGREGVGGRVSEEIGRAHV